MNLDLFHPVRHGLPGRVLGHLLRGKGRALAREPRKPTRPALDQPITFP
jgi:hypothetical protein